MSEIKSPKSAIVTGASSGIGLEIAKLLSSMGYDVLGVARDFSKSHNIDGFKIVELDLIALDGEKLRLLKRALPSPDVLVNCAGIGDFKSFEKQDSKIIEKIIHTNLLSPILLSNFYIDELIKNRGYIFNISSIEALRHSKLSAVYSSSKAGLRAFSLSLFEEVRSKGVKVVSINPDITKTPFFDSSFFTHSDKKNSFLEPTQIANSIKYILEAGENLVITDITIRPLVSKVKIKKELR